MVARHRIALPFFFVLACFFLFYHLGIEISSSPTFSPPACSSAPAQPSSSSSSSLLSLTPGNSLPSNTHLRGGGGGGGGQHAPTAHYRRLADNTTVSFLMPITTTRGVPEQLLHQFKLCNYAFDEVLVVFDTSGRDLPKEELEELERWLSEGLVTRFLVTDYSTEHAMKLYSPLFAPNFLQNRHSSSQLQVKAPGDRGYLSYIELFHSCTSDYCVHFDTDITGSTVRGFSWVEECIHTMRRYNQHHTDTTAVFCSLPIEPPKPDWSISLPADLFNQSITVDAIFSTRVNVIDRRLYFSKLVPFDYKFEQWEISVERSAQQKSGRRLRLQGGAWSLHAAYHTIAQGPERTNMLQCIERGIILPELTNDLPSNLKWPLCPPLLPHEYP